MDFKNTMRSSMPLVGIGVLLVFISLGIQVASLLLTGPTDITATLPVLGNTSIPELAYMVFSYLTYPLFFTLFFWGGMRGVKRYGLDTVGSASAVALSYVIVGVLSIALGLVVSLLVINNLIQTSHYGSVESALATALFGETAGAFGIALTGLCGVGILAIGALMNFVVGGVGAILAQR